MWINLYTQRTLVDAAASTNSADSGAHLVRRARLHPNNQPGQMAESLRHSVTE